MIQCVRRGPIERLAVKIPGRFVWRWGLTAVLASFVPGVVPAFAEAQGLPSESPYLLYVRPAFGVCRRSELGEDRILYNTAPYVAPQFSPDGARILFHSVETGAPGLWLAGVDGAHRERLCDGMQGSWSPDGLRIVLVREGRIVERTVASGEERVLSPADAPPLAFPSYLAGGGVVCTDAAGTTLYVLRPEAATPLERLLEGEFLSPPRGSPDGQRLAYQNGAHVYVMDLASRVSQQVTLDSGLQGWPVWSADGLSLCYAQSRSPEDREWDICWVAVSSPETMHFVERNVYPAFDWRGPVSISTITEKLPGTGLRVWQAAGAEKIALTAEELVAAGWTDITEQAQTGPVIGKLGIENDWVVFDASREGLILNAKEGTVPTSARIRVTRDDGQDAGAITGLELRRITADGVEVAAIYGDATASAPTALTVILWRTRPMIAVRLTPDTGRLSFEADLLMVVTPDRLADDILLTPSSGDPGRVRALPKSPAAIGCFKDREALLLVAAPSPEQRFAAVNSEDGARISSIAVTPSGERVVLALLSVPGIWRTPEVAADAGGRWSAQWRAPFPAQWRMAVRGNGIAYARMCTGDMLGKLGGGNLPIDEAFASAPESAAVYAWGRDLNTPRAVLTPADVLLDALGDRGYGDAFDLEGLLGYRKADVWTPYAELATHGPDWEPWHAHEQHSDLGVLEVMAAAFPAGTDTGRTFLDHLGNDALNLLRGLDTRIAEYEQFLEELEAFGGEDAAVAPEKFPATIRAEAAAALEAGRKTPRTPIAEGEKALTDLLSIFGTRDNRLLSQLIGFAELFPEDETARLFKGYVDKPGAMEGRLWHNCVMYFEIAYEPEFQTFSRRCRRILSEQQAILTVYRTAAKRIRDRAGEEIVRDAAAWETGEELRARTASVLRNRYYLEGDWRGETPLREEVTP